AVTERWLKGCRANIAFLAGVVVCFPPMPRQHIELPEDERHFAISGRIEEELHFALAGLLDLYDMTIVGSERRAVFLERLHGKNDIIGGFQISRGGGGVGARAGRVGGEKCRRPPEGPATNRDGGGHGHRR